MEAFEGVNYKSCGSTRKPILGMEQAWSWYNNEVLAKHFKIYRNANGSDPEDDIPLVRERYRSQTEQPVQEVVTLLHELNSEVNKFLVLNDVNVNKFNNFQKRIFKVGMQMT